MNGPRSTDEGRDAATNDRRWPRVAAVGALVIAIAVVVWLGASAQRSDDATIDLAAATAIARHFLEEAHGSGTTVANVEIMSISLGSDSAGRRAWKVNIGGDVIEAGRTSPAYSSYMWLDVDAESGAVTLVAQG